MFYIVMEYIEGVSLADTLPNMSLPRHQIDLDEIERQLGGIVGAISGYGYAPAAIEASNVMVTPSDRVVLLNYLNMYAAEEDYTYPNVVDEFMDECYRTLPCYDDDEALPASSSAPYRREPYDYSPAPSSRIKPEIAALIIIGIIAVIVIFFLYLIKLDNENTASVDKTAVEMTTGQESIAADRSVYKNESEDVTPEEHKADGRYRYIN
jgi:hypothetical protein